RPVRVNDSFPPQTLREGLGSAMAARPRSRRSFWLIAAAAAILVVGFGAFFLVGKPAAPIAEGKDVRGKGQGAERGSLAAGQGLKTVGSSSAATILFPDGTRVTLEGDTAIDSVDVGS